MDKAQNRAVRRKLAILKMGSERERRGMGKKKERLRGVKTPLEKK